MATGIQVTFDCASVDRMATFWAVALGYVKQPPPEGHDSWEAFAATVGIPESEWDKMSALIDPDGAGPRLLFQKVPEGKTAKNRVHLDVNISKGVPADQRQETVQGHVRKLVDAGAERVEILDEHGDYWVVLQDVEGNEFCVQ
ncbi:MAG: VOC family protein [Geodermatophilaceae bacterium]|nr:VOC family protein [Geodermatophilaceae bacterium]